MRAVVGPSEKYAGREKPGNTWKFNVLREGGAYHCFRRVPATSLFVWVRVLSSGAPCGGGGVVRSCEDDEGWTEVGARLGAARAGRGTT